MRNNRAPRRHFSYTLHFIIDIPKIIEIYKGTQTDKIEILFVAFFYYSFVSFYVYC